MRGTRGFLENICSICVICVRFLTFFHCIIGQRYGTLLAFLGRNTHYIVSAMVIDGGRLKTKMYEGTAQGHTTDIHAWRTQQLLGNARTHKLTRLSTTGQTEVLCHQILFVIRCGVRLIMLLQAFYLRLVEPVLEALLIQGVGLGIDTVVVERSGQGRLDAIHLEGQPAARARRVRQELRVVARAAERCQVRQRLMVAAVRLALVYRGRSIRAAGAAAGWRTMSSCTCPARLSG